MGSIRPLVTITIILVAGAYLFVKINDGPVAPVSGTADPWQSEADVPPLASTVGASTADTTAPSWPSSSPATAPVGSGFSALGSTQSAPATADVATSADALPAVPAIPELPDMPATNDSTSETAAPSASIPTTLPANIPTASYPDAPSVIGVSASSDPLSSQTSSTAGPASSSEQSAPISNTASEATPPVTSALPSISPIEAPLSQNPLRQTAPPNTMPDRYAATAVTPMQSAAATSTPLEASFAASWPEIQTALDRGELASAHQLLSKWYDDPSLTPTDAEKVETLLGQLAGTVIYSTEHQLEAAHVVQAGETLETIAKEHNVPWQLLAKINGVAAVDQVQPGQQLKVVPGPFSAVVDLRRSQLTLMVDGRYAGKFPVAVPAGATVAEGEWLVDQKLIAPSASAVTSSFAAGPTAVDRAIVLRGDSGAAPIPTGPTLTIASGTSPGTTSATAPAIQVAPADAEELSDILSIGSRVVIRR